MRTNYIKRTVFGVLIIAWLIMIYDMSAKTGTQSGGISEKIVVFLRENASIFKILSFDKLNLLIRKAAHFTEYGLLAVWVINFAYTFEQVREKYMVVFIVASIFVCICGGLDEFHQSFVDGRGPAVMDVVIDTCGGIVFGVFATMKNG